MNHFPNTNSFLKICYYFNLIAILFVISLPFFMYYRNILFPNTEIKAFSWLILTINLPVSILWVYSIYFCWKYDKYSSAIIKLIFLGIFFTPIYYYKVIWKRKRSLINSYNAESVLGNKIKLEDDNDY